MNGLQGKTVLIAGGTGGVGTATALRLGAEGANVVVGSRREESAALVADAVTAAGGAAVAVRMDIVDDASVAAAVRTAAESFDGLDAVHVNAANMTPEVITNDSDAVSIDFDVFDATVQVNLRGAFLCARHAVPALLASGGGALVFTSSSAAFVGEPERPAYAMTKTGMHALVRHVASRWGREGIRANAVAPGPVPSEAVLPYLDQSMLDGMLSALRSPRLGRPDDVAGMVAFLVSDDGEWINGQVINVDGGMVLR
jgi:NAD(P)-dependent dehydrogenase (short-subunit alcohol dehydrogenase family)